MSLYERFTTKGPSGFGYGSTAEQVTEGMSLAGKTYLVTGCNSGLGQEALRVLTMRGGRVVGTARTLEKAKAACAAVTGDTVPLACELSEPTSVRACVAEVRRQGLALDAIICNAGIMEMRTEQVLGYERQFFTNHIGHFILVTGLLEQLTETGRVVMLSSNAHTMAPKDGIQFENLGGGAKGHKDMGTYGHSKLANLLFAKELARRFAGTKKTANAVHPGVIHTNLGRNTNPVFMFLFGLLGPLVLKSVSQGAATEVYVATNPATATISGEYFADCNLAKARADADDAVMAQKLWSVSEKIVAELGAN
jgi:NAD(P)-dependent dehydrogenase (short-subunit alcohol dehydrogenase family)